MEDENIQKTRWYDLKDKTKRNIKLGTEINKKVEQLGMRRPPVGTMGANLSDICIDLEEYVQLIIQFLDSETEDKELIGDILVEMKTHLDNVKWHYSQVKKALERVTEYCYRESEKSENIP